MYASRAWRAWLSFRVLTLRSRGGARARSSASSRLSSATCWRLPIPGVSAGEVCAEIAEDLARTEKACAAARVRYAARAAECGEHRKRGFADRPSGWHDPQGRRLGEARAALGTVEGPRCVSGHQGCGEGRRGVAGTGARDRLGARPRGRTARARSHVRLGCGQRRGTQVAPRGDRSRGAVRASNTRRGSSSTGKTTSA